ncbi:MAG: tyrosine-protein phosphatase [Gemmataceae bacterium]
MKPRGKFVLFVALLLAPLASYIGYLQFTNNFHTVQEGVCYRSGQPSTGNLEDWIKSYHIQTIINLRGPNPSLRWYQQERQIAERHGVKMVDVILSAYERPFEDQLQILVDSMRDEPRPLLIHCAGGSDRAGFASALFLMLHTDTPTAEARGQLTYLYGHFPLGMKKTLPEIFDQYESWLNQQQLSHSPTHLRHWCVHEYQRDPSHDTARQSAPLPETCETWLAGFRNRK